MSTQAILDNQNLNKTQKALALFALGHTRREVADLALGGNYGFAQNVFVRYTQNLAHTAQLIAQSPAFQFDFTRKFGVEIEGYNTQNLIEKLTEEGLVANRQTYNHTTSRNWKIVPDGSIQGHNTGELVSPILKGEDGINQLKKACRALALAGVKTNSSCGVHIHLDANDFDLQNFKTLAKNILSLEAQIDKMMPPSRHNGSYCASMQFLNTPTNLAKLDEKDNITELIYLFETRHLKVNLEAYTRHGTVEFRQHGASIKFFKIKNWIKICARIMEASKQNILINNLTEILDETLNEYYEDRVLDFV